VYSEIYLRFKDEITLERMMVGMPPSAEPGRVLRQTYFRNSTDVLSSVAYAHVETSCVYIVFREVHNALRIHVERRTGKGEISNLARKSEEIARRFIDSAERSGYRLDVATIRLSADDDLITIGTRYTPGKRLARRFRESIFGDVFTGFFTAVLTLLFTKNWEPALIAGGAAVSCSVLWVLLEARSDTEEYDYHGF
jgi:hypothetical protein